MEELPIYIKFKQKTDIQFINYTKEIVKHKTDMHMKGLVNLAEIKPTKHYNERKKERCTVDPLTILNNKQIPKNVFSYDDVHYMITTLHTFILSNDMKKCITMWNNKITFKEWKRKKRQKKRLHMISKIPVE